MKDEYIYCALNDCNINKGLSRCCFYCHETKCPDRCDKTELTFCVNLMAELKELKEENQK